MSSGVTSGPITRQHTLVMAASAKRLKQKTSQFRDTILSTWTSTDQPASTVSPDADILHAVDHALGAAEQDDGKVLYLGADRAGNMLEVVSVTRDDDTPRSSFTQCGCVESTNRSFVR